MAFKTKKLKGITLIEILIATTIMAILVLLVGTAYFAHFRIFSNQSTAMDVTTQNKLALDEITNQVRQSQSVAAGCSACGSDTTGASVLILQLWPLDAQGNPTDPGTSNYDYIEYKLDQTGTKLTKITHPYSGSTRPAGTQIIASSLNNLQFTYDNPTPASADQITINISTTQTNLYGKTFTTTDSSIALLRNK